MQPPSPQTVATPPGSTWFDRPRWGLAILVLVSVVAFAPALTGAYVFDDHELVEHSSLLRGPLWRVWFSADAYDYWPLTYTSFWLVRQLFGTSPLPQHLTNVVLHTVTAALLWRVLLRLRIPGAWLGATLFAVHPVTVESVAWISERKNVLSGALVVGAALVWLSFRSNPSPRRYAASLALFLLALLAKTSVVAFPLVLLGFDLWSHRPLGRRTARELAPSFAASLVFGALTAWFQATNAMGGGAGGAPWLERVGRSAWAWFTYVRHAFLPIDLAFVYPPWPSTSSATFWLPTVLGVAFVGFLGLKGRSGPLRPVTFALGYHLLLVAPVLGLVEMAYFATGPVSNHLQYLALPGATALVGASVAAIAPRLGRLSAAVALALVCACLISTGVRSSAFRDDVTLWRRAVADSPQSFTAAMTAAMRLGEIGQGAEAGRTIAEAAARLEDPASQLRARAMLALLQGFPDDAVAHAQAAAPLRSDFLFTVELGTLLSSEGYPEHAVRLLQPLLEIAPKNTLLRYRLGSALAKTGRKDEALAVVGEACRKERRPCDACTATVMLLGGPGPGARQRLAGILEVAPTSHLLEAIIAPGDEP